MKLIDCRVIPSMAWLHAYVHVCGTSADLGWMLANLGPTERSVLLMVQENIASYDCFKLGLVRMLPLASVLLGHCFLYTPMSTVSPGKSAL